MAAGGFKEFVAGETLDEDEINDYLMQGMLVFAGTAARGSAITSPVEGQFTFLADTDTVEFWDGSAWVELAASPLAVDFLVIGGGGAGGGVGPFATLGGAGGGGGGYRCSVTGEDSGGGASAETAVNLLLDTPYAIKVGAGGSPDNARGGSGADSILGNIISIGGGGGAGEPSGGNSGLTGGSGGGKNATAAPGNGTTNQGFAGGGTAGVNTSGTGGGGADAIGGNAGTNNGGNGGAGLSSSITGSSVGRAGGGGGGRYLSGTGGTASDGGGAGASSRVNGTSGTVNTGGGGGGAGGDNGSTSRIGGSGGSGLIVLSVPSGYTASFTGGVSQTSATVGSNTVYTVTAAGPTDTVTIGAA